MNQEIWKPIVGYKGRYEVSNLGNVRSLSRIVKNGYGSTKVLKERILKQQETKKGYKEVSLIKGSKAKAFRVHRLVAIAFMENREGFPQVNHINEVKTDNRVENLEWCTALYNVRYGDRTDRSRKSNEIAQANPIVQVNIEGVVVNIWTSASHAGRNGFNQSKVSNCCRGLTKKYRGFMWFKKEDWLKSKGIEVIE